MFPQNLVNVDSLNGLSCLVENIDIGDRCSLKVAGHIELFFACEAIFVSQQNIGVTKVNRLGLVV